MRSFAGPWTRRDKTFFKCRNGSVMTHQISVFNFLVRASCVVLCVSVCLCFVVCVLSLSACFVKRLFREAVAREESFALCKRLFALLEEM